MTPQDIQFWQDDEPAFDLRATLYKYIRHGWWFLISLAVCLIGAFFYLRYATPIYKVSATLLIKDEKRGMTSGNEILKELNLGGVSKVVENEIEVLKSRGIMTKVVDALNLTVEYRQAGKVKDSEVYYATPVKVIPEKLKPLAYEEPLYIQPVDAQHFELLDASQDVLGKFVYSTAVNSPYGKIRVLKSNHPDKQDVLTEVRFQNKNGVITGLINGLGVELVNQKSSVLTLSLEQALPEKGEAILAKILEEYTFTTLSDKNQEATNTLNFIEDRLRLVTNELGSVEKDVESYRTSRGITDLSAEASLFLEKAKENDSKLNEVDIQLKVLDGVERYLQSANSVSVAPASLMVSDPVLTQYLGQLSELEMQYEKTARTTQPGNPFLETINKQVANIRQAIRDNVNNQKNSLTITKRSLQGLNNRLEGAISTIPRKEREYVEIKRQAGIKENLYLLLLQKREETALAYASTVTDSRVVDQPFSTAQPVKPSRRNVWLGAFLVGLLFPIGLITARDALTHTVQSKKEIEDKTGLRVFGEIARKESTDGEIIEAKSRSFLSEQIRMIRSNLQYLFTQDTGTEGRVLLFTSSTGGEGKSFVTTNVAASLGLLEKKVVILGLDLRKPKVHEYLNVSNTKGLSTYLIGKASAGEIVQTTALPDVSLIPAGPIPPNPAELIANGRLGDLIRDLKKKYDYILLDTPPLGLVTDAVLMAQYADATFYLVRHERTPRAYLQNIKDLKEKETFKSLQVIFNAVNYKNSPDYGYGYGYGYGGYGYGQGYYGEKKNENKSPLAEILTKRK
ncbi:MAG: GumC family protein [Spirosomataceae bacterium]